MALLSMLSVSCGIIDMELDEEVQNVFDMKLKHDSISVFVGDRFVLEPVFTPDSVNNQEIYVQLNQDGFLEKDNDSILAIGVGETYVTAISVENALVDSCYVNIMEPWSLNPKDYSDDMVVYAKITVDGKPFNPNTMMVAAFSGPEFRGKGEIISIGNQQLLRFRIYRYADWDGSMVGEQELIKFKVYTRENYSLQTFSQYLIFDGETHGSLSEPFILEY